MDRTEQIDVARHTQETFERILDILKQLGLHRQSPKFFIIYAHENDNYVGEANQAVVKDYISWFKAALFNVDSDKSPHGYGPIHASAHEGASVDIVKNQICLLPHNWHKHNVDYVLVFYSKLLARYIKDASEFECAEQPFADALFDACTKYSQSKVPWDKVCEDVCKVQKKYSEGMGDRFHHVLTELALLRFRNHNTKSNYTIPIILFDSDEPGWQWKSGFVSTKDSQIQVKMDMKKQYQLFFKILCMFETLESDRPLIEAMLECFEKCVALLSEKGIEPARYHTEREINISGFLRKLNDSGRFQMIDRPITIGHIRDVLNLYSTLERESIRRVSGERLPANLCDISLSVNKELEEKEDLTLHGIFEKRKLKAGKEEDIPKRIFIKGKPGIGKTTLCTRIMYEYSWHRDLRNKFDLVVLLPVRRLKFCTDLSELLFEEFFQVVAKGREMANKLKELILDPEETKILIIFDGLDESRGWLKEERTILQKLIDQPVVIITSRECDAGVSSIDLQAEAQGLSTKSVDAYLENRDFISKSTAQDIRHFIYNNGFIKEMIQVPIHLDILCCSWDDLQRQNVPCTAIQSEGEDQSPTVTALYQAIVGTLWRKDIPQLGKLDYGEQLTEDIVMAVRDASRLDRVVWAESAILGRIAFQLMDSGRFEFSDTDIGEAIGQFEKDGGAQLKAESNQLPLSLERNLCKLSLLNTGNYGQGREFNFIHLTFQEFFAARWLAEDPTRLRQYLGQYKYNSRFETVWRFVSGLLESRKDQKQLCQFFSIIEEEPRDLLGPVHQRLVMHCLNEVRTQNNSLFLKHRIHLEMRLRTWLLFECSLGQQSELAADMTFPELIFRDILEKDCQDSKVKVLWSLCGRRKLSQKILLLATSLLQKDFPQKSTGTDLELAILHMLLHRPESLSDEILKALVKELGNPNKNIGYIITHVLQRKSPLPGEILQAIVAQLGNLSRDATYLATFILGNHVELSDENITDIIEGSKTPKILAKYTATRISHEQLVLSNEILEVIIEKLANIYRETPRNAAKTSRNQLNLPEDDLQAIVEQLGHPNNDTQRHAANILEQSDLPKGILQAVVELLGHYNNKTKYYTAEILQKRSDLPQEILQAVVEQLGHPNQHTTHGAAGILQKQSDLPKEILQAIVQQLGHPNHYTRYSAAEILQQSDLPKEILQAIVEQLGHPNYNTRLHATIILGKQLGFSEDKCKFIREQLRVSNSNSADVTLRRLLGLRNENVLDDIADQVGESNGDPLMQESALTDEGFESIIDNMDTPSFTGLYYDFLRRSFLAHLAWYADGETCHIDTPEEHTTVTSRRFLCRIRETRHSAEMPSLSDAF